MKDKIASTKTGLKIDPELFSGAVVHENLSKENILVSSDKVRLCLIEYQRFLKAGIGWVAPAGLSFSALATLVAADFKDFLGFNFFINLS